LKLSILGGESRKLEVEKEKEDKYYDFEEDEVVEDESRTTNVFKSLCESVDLECKTYRKKIGDLVNYYSKKGIIDFKNFQGFARPRLNNPEDQNRIKQLFMLLDTKHKGELDSIDLIKMLLQKQIPLTIIERIKRKVENGLQI
jgi:Ca2+-binding EF-hand superfamily protein